MVEKQLNPTFLKKHQIKKLTQYLLPALMEAAAAIPNNAHFSFLKKCWVGKGFVGRRVSLPIPIMYTQKMSFGNFQCNKVQAIMRLLFPGGASIK